VNHQSHDLLPVLRVNFNAAQLVVGCAKIKERSEPHRESRGYVGGSLSVKLHILSRTQGQRPGAEEKPLPSNQVLMVTVTRAKPKSLVDPTANPITAKAAKEPERV